MTAPLDLTPLYNFIFAFSAVNGYPPTVAEICTAFGWKSTASAHRRLMRLAREGRATHKPGLARSWVVVR